MPLQRPLIIDSTTGRKKVLPAGDYLPVPTGGFPYVFSTTVTDADPGAGVIRFNNATLASVTQLFVDDVAVGGADASAWLESLDDSTNTVKGTLLITAAGAPMSSPVVFKVSGSVVSVTGYKKVPVTYVSGTIPADGAELAVFFAPSGDKGNDGGGASPGNIMRSAVNSGAGGTTITSGGATIGSVTITPMRSDSRILILARMGAVKDSGTTRRTVSVVVKRGGVTVSVESVIYSQNIATTPFGPAVVLDYDSPGVTTAVTYDIVATDASGSCTSDDWEIVVVDLTGADGTPGTNGHRGGVRFNFSTTTTDSDPGEGVVRFNNATIGSVTQIFIDNAAVGGTDVSVWLDAFDDSTNTVKGVLTFMPAANTSTAPIIFNVSGSVVNGTGYRKLTVAHVAGVLPADNAELVAHFSRTGDKGADGGGGGSTIAPSQITSWQNNYNPSGWADSVARILFDTNGFYFLTGLEATTEGHIVELLNPTDYCLGLKHGSLDSDTENRFDFADNAGKFERDIMVYPGESTILIYRNSRWRHIAGGRVQDVPHKLGHWLYDEMLQRAQPEVGWFATLNSGGTPTDLLAINSPEQSRLGVYQFSTAASSSASTNKSTYSTANAVSADTGHTDNYLIFESVQKWPAEAATATEDYYISNLGIANSYTGNVTRGCCIYYDRITNGGNWRLFRRNSTVNGTINASAGPVFGVYSRIRIVQYPNGLAELWQDGVMIAQSTDATLILDQPSGASWYFYKTAGTTARVVRLDSVGVGQIRAKAI